MGRNRKSKIRNNEIRKFKFNKRGTNHLKKMTTKGIRNGRVRHVNNNNKVIFLDDHESDCEIIEIPSDVIVVDADAVAAAAVVPHVYSTNQNNEKMDENEKDLEDNAEDDNLFYEDKCPGSANVVPIYNKITTVLCTTNDNSSSSKNNNNTNNSIALPSTSTSTESIVFNSNRLATNLIIPSQTTKLRNRSLSMNVTSEFEESFIKIDETSVMKPMKNNNKRRKRSLSVNYVNERNDRQRPDRFRKNHHPISLNSTIIDLTSADELNVTRNIESTDDDDDDDGDDEDDDDNDDDSLIFVSETILPSVNVIPNINPKRYRKNKKRKRGNNKNNNNRSNSNIRTCINKPIACEINENENNGTKRMIIIDGSNVAFNHSCNTFFSVKGIEICLEYFERNGYEAIAVVPQMRLKRSMNNNSELLSKLYEQKKIVLTPCKNLSGKYITSYDDRFIIEMAEKLDAAIISNDNYRDLAFEKTEWKEIIETRVIGFTFCKDILLLPQDPYGKSGPKLDNILKRME